METYIVCVCVLETVGTMEMEKKGGREVKATQKSQTGSTHSHTRRRTRCKSQERSVVKESFSFFFRQSGLV